MFGVGPGQLTSDAEMLGIDPNDKRRRMMESFEVIMALFAGETVNVETDWFICRDAVLQMKPYSNFEVACASTMSPSGSKLAGRYGTGLISVAATEPAAFEVLDYNYQVWNEEAALNGHVADRNAWRLMGPDTWPRPRPRLRHARTASTACSGSSTISRTSSTSATRAPPRRPPTRARLSTPQSSSARCSSVLLTWPLLNSTG